MKPAKIFLSSLIFSFFAVFSASPVFAADAALSLSPREGEVASGNTLEVDINVDTGGASVSAIDIIVSFDPSKFEVSVDDSSKILSQFYPSDANERVDNNAGEVRFNNFVGATEDPFSGQGTISTLVLTPKVDSGTSSFMFDFTEGSEADCNVIDTATVSDILTTTEDGTYSITAGSGGDGDTSPTPTTAANPTSSPTPSPASRGADDTEDTGGTEDSTPTPTTATLPETNEAPDTGDSLVSALLTLFGASLLFTGVLFVL